MRLSSVASGTAEEGKVDKAEDLLGDTADALGDELATVEGLEDTVVETAAVEGLGAEDVADGVEVAGDDVLAVGLILRVVQAVAGRAEKAVARKERQVGVPDGRGILGALDEDGLQRLGDVLDYLGVGCGLHKLCVGFDGVLDGLIKLGRGGVGAAVGVGAATGVAAATGDAAGDAAWVEVDVLLKSAEDQARLVEGAADLFGEVADLADRGSLGDDGGYQRRVNVELLGKGKAAGRRIACLAALDGRSKSLNLVEQRVGDTATTPAAEGKARTARGGLASGDGFAVNIADCGCRSSSSQGRDSCGDGETHLDIGVCKENWCCF